MNTALDLLTLAKNDEKSPRFSRIQSAYKGYTGREIFSEAIINKLENEANTQITGSVDDFPFSQTTWQGLAQVFNGSSLEVKTEIFKQVFKDVVGFDADSEVSAFGFSKKCASCKDRLYTVMKIDGALGESIHFKQTPEATQEEQDELIRDIKAKVENDSLVFTIGLPTSKITLRTDRLPEYLSRGGPALTQHAVDVPATAAELRNYLDSNDVKEYKRKLIKVAIRHFKGGYDKDSGNMIYLLQDAQWFWIAHAIVSRHPSFTRETDWEGGFRVYWPIAAEGIQEVIWYKPSDNKFNEFKVAASYSAHGDSGIHEGVCFGELKPVTFLFRFDHQN